MPFLRHGAVKYFSHEHAGNLWHFAGNLKLESEHLSTVPLLLGDLTTIDEIDRWPAIYA